MWTSGSQSPFCGPIMVRDTLIRGYNMENVIHISSFMPKVQSLNGPQKVFVVR